MLKWLFFDLGSTLIDETDCQAEWIRRTVDGADVTFEEFEAAYRSFAARNLDGYDRARALFNLEKGPWPTELERLYPGTAELLKELTGRYSLGVIANQRPGLRDRLDRYGIGRFFEVVAGSGDMGVSKPNPELFRRALELAGCRPEDAMMIGDRLDNDIVPAQSLGMRTLWVRQCYGALGDVTLLGQKPDGIAERLLDITSFV